MNHLASLDAGRLAVLSWDLPDIGSDRPVDASSLTGLVGWAADERLTGLLVGLIESLGAPLPARVAEVHHGALRHSLAVEARAARTVSTLADAGIAAALFKGIAAAHADYPTAAHRTFFDADLLVRRDDFLPAIDELSARGYTAEPMPLGRGWTAAYGRAVALRDRDGLHVDVHAAIAPGFFGMRLDHTSLIAADGSITIGDTACPVFDPPGRLLATSYAIVLSRGPKLRLHRDLAQQLANGTDWRTAVGRASDGDVVVAKAITATAELLADDHPAVRWSRQRLAAARPLDRHAVATSRWAADARREWLALAWTRRFGYAAGIGRGYVTSLRRRSQAEVDG